MGKLLAIVTALLLASIALGVSPAHAQTDGEPSAATCSAGNIAWNRARERGPVGRREALKAVLAAAAADDASAVPCLVKKSAQVLTLIASETSALEGWAPLLKENRSNMEAAKAQPVKDQCAAYTVFEDAWERFHANSRPDVPELVGQALLRDKKVACGEV